MSIHVEVIVNDYAELGEGVRIGAFTFDEFIYDDVDEEAIGMAGMTGDFRYIELNEVAADDILVVQEHCLGRRRMYYRAATVAAVTNGVATVVTTDPSETGEFLVGCLRDNFVMALRKAD